MSARISTPKLDRLKSFLLEIGGTYTLNFRFADEESKVKRAALSRTGREFFGVTMLMRQHVLRVLKQETLQAMRMNVSTYEQVRIATADAMRQWIVNRFATQGPDVRLRPLSSRYLAFKQRHPLYDTRIGIARGNLFRDVKVRATVYMRKVRPG